MAKKSEIKITDHAGNTVFVNMTDIKTHRLNQWQGWFCGLGMENFNILNSGRMHGGVCKTGRELGNVYTSFKMNTEPTKCDKPSCHCGSDILIPKAKTEKEFAKLMKHQINSRKVKYENVIAVDGHFQMRKDNTIAIDWNVGKRCNYNCSYCPDNVHDKKSPHISLSKFLTALNNIEKNIPRDKNLKVTFTGGEPTFNPDFFPFVSLLKNKYKERITIFTNTNGSHTKEYLDALNKYSTLLISVHFEFTNVKRLIEKIRYLVKVRQQEQRYDRKTLLYVKIMVTPTTLQNAKELFFELTHFRTHVFDLRVNLEPIVDKEDDYKLISYSDDQKNIIRKINEHDRLLRTHFETIFKKSSTKKLFRSKEFIERTFANVDV